jgi:hypothetical protein
MKRFVGWAIHICLCACARIPFNTVRFFLLPWSRGSLDCTGISRDAPADDPQLGNKRSELVTLAVQKLSEARMIAFDRANGVFTITDLGRIAAKYYIRHSSIEIYNKEFRQKMTEADVLAMLSMSTEVSIFRIGVGWMKRLHGWCTVRSNSSPRNRSQGTRTVDGDYTVCGEGKLCSVLFSYLTPTSV